MAPENPRWLRVFELLSAEPSVAEVHYIEPKSHDDKLRVRWDDARAPSRFTSVANGVVYVRAEGGIDVWAPSRRELEPDSNRYLWREGLDAADRHMLVLVLPEGRTLANPDPEPMDAKVCHDGRLAVYWIVGPEHIRDGGVTVLWDLELQTDGPHNAARAIRRALRPTGMIDVGRRLVYFVHGLGGDAEATWRNEEHSSSFGQLVRSELGIDTGFFSYPTSLWRGPFFSGEAPRIQKLAQGLQTKVDLDYRDYGDITLVCHSLGGLVARWYLLREVKLDKELRVQRLVLFATPNKGAAIARIGKMLSWRHNQLAQLGRGSEFLRNLNQDWGDMRMGERVATTFVTAGLDKVVDQESAQEFWGQRNVRMVLEKGHVDIVKPDGPTDDAFKILEEALWRT